MADRLPFSCTPVLDWFHISMRVRYLEQIVKGMRARTETEKAARRVLISRIDRLRCRRPALADVPAERYKVISELQREGLPIKHGY